jgi:hypothetical protein
LTHSLTTGTLDSTMQRSQSVPMTQKLAKVQEQQRGLGLRGPACKRCSRRGIQVAEAVARERRKAKERARAALERARVQRRERVAAERAKWRITMNGKLKAVRAKAAEIKARKTAAFWAKKAANKAARLAIGGPVDGTWVWGEDCLMELDTCGEDAAPVVLVAGDTAPSSPTEPDETTPAALLELASESASVAI